MKKIISLLLIIGTAGILSGCGAMNMRIVSDDRVHWDYGYTDKFEGMGPDRDMPYAPYNHPAN